MEQRLLIKLSYKVTPKEKLEVIKCLFIWSYAGKLIYQPLDENSEPVTIETYSWMAEPIIVEG